MNDTIRVLLVEDDADDAALLKRALQRGGLAPAITRVETREAFEAALDEGAWDVIISDYNLPQFSGVEALEIARRCSEEYPFIIASGEIGEAVAVEAMRAGAHDYVLKDNLARLAPAVRREVREAETRREQRRATEALRSAEDRWGVLQETLAELSRDTAGETDRAFLRRLVREVWRITGVQYALIANFTDSSLMRVRTEAYCIGGTIVDNVEWDLADTPCADVYDKGFCCVPASVQALFPRDHVLQEMGAESYLGCVLRDPAGAPVGHMALLDVRPFTNAPFLQTLLSIFATRASAELQRSAMLRGLEMRDYAINNAPESMFNADSAGRITWVNDTACRRLGYGRDELLHMHIREIDADFTPEEFGMQWEEMRRGRPLTTVRHLRASDGALIPAEITLSLVLLDGREVLFAFARDVTERVRAEEEKRALQEALAESQRMEALGTLAGGVAHDFNNILTGISGNAELALAAPNPAEARPSLEAIQSAVQRARDVVQRILTFSRRQRIDRRVTRLPDAVADAIRLMRASLPATIDIRVTSSAGELTILADSSQVHQVVMNLCTNAAQAISASPRGGAGTIHVMMDEVGWSTDLARRHPHLTPGHYVRLAVRDNGIGMDDATRGRIFEPFFTTKKPGEGTGLGLAVVHGIVREHQGAIDVESHAGAGATFTAYFPRTDEPLPAARVTPPRATRANAARVLFVDDEPSIVFVGSRLLQISGYHVTTQTDPRAALETFRAQPADFDLVITDLTMPTMNGIELATELRAVRPALPVIITTGYVHGISADHEALGVHILLKPFDLDTLVDTVSEALAPSSN